MNQSDQTSNDNHHKKKHTKTHPNLLFIKIEKLKIVNFLMSIKGVKHINIDITCNLNVAAASPIFFIDLERFLVDSFHHEKQRFQVEQPMTSTK